MDLNNTLKAAATLPRIEMMSIIIKLNAKNKKLENQNRELKQTIKDDKEYIETLSNFIYDVSFTPPDRPTKEEK